jgi:flagellar hook protein FlgE
MSLRIDTGSIAAAYAELSIIGNNISNSNTVGYKSSSFRDILGQSIGSGTTENFAQGAINVQINRPLDVAIKGNGFFKVMPMNDPTSSGSAPTKSGPPVYTRDGQFAINANGYLTDNSGNYVMGMNGISEGPILVDTSNPAKASVSGTIKVNLDSGVGSISDNGPIIPLTLGAPLKTSFNPNDSSTFNHSSQSTVLDSSGTSTIITSYYVKNPITSGSPQTLPKAAVLGALGTPEYPEIPEIPGPPVIPGTPLIPGTPGTYGVPASTGAGHGPITSWDVYTVRGDSSSVSPGQTKDYTMNFNNGGQLLSAVSYTGAATAIEPKNIILGKDDLGNSTITTELSAAPGIIYTIENPTQYANPFSDITSTNGNAAGTMLSVSVGSDGSIIPVYSDGLAGNSTPRPLTQKIELYLFQNQSGLQQVNSNQWYETKESGKPNAVAVGTQGSGSLQGNATEASNVNITTAMIDLLSAQRSFQAISQVVNTESEALQSIVQMGR